MAWSHPIRYALRTILAIVLFVFVFMAAAFRFFESPMDALEVSVESNGTRVYTFFVFHSLRNILQVSIVVLENIMLDFLYSDWIDFVSHS